MGAAAHPVSALRERAAAMVERVTLETSYLLGERGAASVRVAVTAALAPRDAALEDDHDPRLLHPARTILILLSDATVRDADVLAAAAFAESLPDTATNAAEQSAAGAMSATTPAAARAALGPAAAALLESVPLPRGGDVELLESLVVAPEAAALIALAERLDHARHLHMMKGIDRAAFLDGIRHVYMPAAARISPPLFHRLERWARSFARRRMANG